MFSVDNMKNRKVCFFIYCLAGRMCVQKRIALLDDGHYGNLWAQEGTNKSVFISTVLFCCDSKSIRVAN